MSWIRSAMNKAAEVSGGTNIRAAVRTYADTVVQNAGYVVVEGAKKLQDRIAARNMNSSKDAIRRLEEVSVSCKGEERVQLLRRWLVALKEIEKLYGGSVENDGKISQEPLTSSDRTDSPRKPTVVLYCDPDHGGSPLNFRDIFLQSQALEGMIMSMILGEPNEEEILLLREIFGLCLTGGKEVHDVILKSIHDLAKYLSAYDDEVLAKREELLQFAQAAITGVKMNAEVVRIDSEVSQIRQNLNRMEHRKRSGEGHDNSSEAISEVITDSVAHIQLCGRLESLLLKKRLLNHGDAPEIHAQKVDKLKVLSESLLSSASKTERRMSEQRQQKEEALCFRVAKTSEVSQIEKDLGAEIAALEKKRDELEAELNKVKGSLAAATFRLQNAREEREQFDEASNEILEHFNTKEDELSKAIALYRAEADACNAFVNFLEATWVFQSSYMAQKDQQVSDELKKHEEYFVNVTRSLLSAYKDELVAAVANVRKLVESLKGAEHVIDPDEEFLQDIERRKNLEQEYVDAETKLITLLDAVDRIKEQFYNAIDGASRKGVEAIRELFGAIGKIKGDFESIRRPILSIETPSPGEDMPTTEGPPAGISPSSARVLAERLNSVIAQTLVIGSPKNKRYIPLGGSTESAESVKGKLAVREGERAPIPPRQLWKLALEFDKENRELPTPESDRKFETAKNEEGKITQPSVSEGEKSLEPNKDSSTLALKSVKTEKAGSENEKSLDPDEDLPKSTLGVEQEDGQHSTEEVSGWEFDELEKELEKELSKK